MIGAARRYRELLTALLLDRALAGGELSEEEESLHVEELDRCWWAMTHSEQEDTERWLATERPPDGPPDLGELDVPVAMGGHSAPRKKSA